MWKLPYQVPEAEPLVINLEQACLQDSSNIDDGSADGEWGDDIY